MRWSHAAANRSYHFRNGRLGDSDGDPTPAPVLWTVPVATLKQLHTELAAVGLPVIGAEATGTAQFGPETQARVRTFQQLHGLPVTATVDPTTGGIMTLAALGQRRATATSCGPDCARPKARSPIRRPTTTGWLATPSWPAITTSP